MATTSNAAENSNNRTAVPYETSNAESETASRILVQSPRKCGLPARALRAIEITVLTTIIVSMLVLLSLPILHRLFIQVREHMDYTILAAITIRVHLILELQFYILSVDRKVLFRSTAAIRQT